MTPDNQNLVAFVEDALARAGRPSGLAQEWQRMQNHVEHSCAISMLPDPLPSAEVIRLNELLAAENATAAECQQNLPQPPADEPEVLCVQWQGGAITFERSSGQFFETKTLGHDPVLIVRRVLRAEAALAVWADVLAESINISGSAPGIESMLGAADTWHEVLARLSADGPASDRINAAVQAILHAAKDAELSDAWCSASINSCLGAAFLRANDAAGWRVPTGKDLRRLWRELMTKADQLEAAWRPEREGDES